MSTITAVRAVLAARLSVRRIHPNKLRQFCPDPLGPRHAAMIGDGLPRTSALQGCWETICKVSPPLQPAEQVRRD